METIVLITQCASVILVLLLLAALTLSLLYFVLATIRDIYRARYYARRTEVLKKIGNEIYNDAHWFSESEHAWQALRVLGQTLYENGNYQISSLRTRWRESMNEPEQ